MGVMPVMRGVAHRPYENDNRAAALMLLQSCLRCFGPTMRMPELLRLPPPAGRRNHNRFSLFLSPPAPPGPFLRAVPLLTAAGERMSIVYRVFRRTDRGSQVIAEVRGANVTGLFADLVRERLLHAGFPHIPVEEALQRLPTCSPRYFGFDRV